VGLEVLEGERVLDVVVRRNNRGMIESRWWGDGVAWLELAYGLT